MCPDFALEIETLHSLRLHLQSRYLGIRSVVAKWKMEFNNLHGKVNVNIYMEN